MTATEVLERTREKGILLAPTVGRQQDEYLGPLIEREVDVLLQLRLLPPPPPALVEANGEYTIEYDSPMSRAARAEEAAGFARTLEQATNVVNVTQDPSLLDHFDFDTALPEIAEINGTPFRWMASPDKIAKRRQDRQNQIDTQTAIQAAPGAAALMKAGAAVQQQAGAAK